MLLRRFWWAIPIGALIIALALVVLKLEARTAERDKWQTQAVAEKQAHEQTVANYRAASAEAQRQAVANVDRVKAEQARITTEVETSYEKRVLAVRTEFANRLRASERTASGSSSGQPTLPAAITAPGEAYETSCKDRLPSDDALIASEQAIQLDELITWIERQALLDFGGQRP